MRKKIVGMIIGIILLFSIGVYGKEKPHWNSDVNTIYGDGIVVQFHERTPTYHIWVPGKNNTAVYIVKFNRIIEFIDTNNNGKFDGETDQLLAHAPLTAHDIWTVAAEQMEGENGVFELKISFNATVEVTSVSLSQEMDGGQRVGYAKVAFINHIYDQDVDVNGYEIAGGRELKIDIVISDWPWSNSESKLALEIVFAGFFRGHSGIPKCHREQTQTKAGKMSHIRLEGDADYDVEFKYREEATIRDNQATGCHINASDQFREKSAVTWLVYPHFNGTLIHDPSICAGTPEGTLLDTIKTYMPLIAIVVIIVIVLVVIKKK